MRRHQEILGAALAILGILALAGPTQAHFQVYWPRTPGCYGKPGEPAAWTFFWGHPYEMLVDDAPGGLTFTLRAAGGKKVPAILREIRLTDPESKQERRAYEVECTPLTPGDYYLTLEAPPCFIPEEQMFCQDYVKAVWHVGAEKGWEERLGLEVEIVPLTRPYGWPAGVAFSARALFKGAPLKLAPVEVEKFTGFPVPPEQRPKDRFGQENTPLMTRTARTDLNGSFTVTLESPGWWLLSVSRQDGKLTKNGRPYPLEKRGCLWVFVEKPPPPPTPPGK